MKYQVALLLHTLGDEALLRYNGFKFDSEEENRTVDEIIEKFNEHVIGEVNVIYERYRFNKRTQEENESFDNFLTATRVLIKTCNYCEKCVDSVLRDRIVLGIREIQVQEQLLRERDLTLDKCIDMCRAAEYAYKKGKEFRPETINRLQNDKRYVRREESRNERREDDRKYRSESGNETRSCKFCGRKHKFQKEMCPAWGKTCSKCLKKNHFAKLCKGGVEKKDNIYQIESDTESEGWVNHVRDKTNDIKCIMLVNDQEVKFQLDTGASVNILPKSFASGIDPTQKTLKMWNGSIIQPLGVHREHVINPKNKKKYNIEFTIVDDVDAQPLLGIRAVQAMQLITIEESEFHRVNTVGMVEYGEVFSEGLGILPGIVHLETKPDVMPSTMSAQRVPIAMREKLKRELDRLQDRKVIRKVTEPTSWTSNVVIVEKPNGTVRLCINPLELNKALRRPRFLMPSLEEVLHKLSGSTVFSKFDLRNGYWHVQLDEESSLLTTFQTSFGTYRWLRLPFGLNVASEIFQMKMQQSFENLTGLINIADDIVIYGKDGKHHDENLRMFLEKCKELGVKLNKDKLELNCQEISFMGHKISKEGIRPDPKKIQAIIDMEEPGNKEELKRFLGMCNYQIKFLPGYASISEPLYKLLKNEVAWNWNSVQSEAMKQLKILLTEAPTLKIFDSKNPIQIECDSSQFGLGAVLLQNSSTIAYASRTLNDSERNYAQIEKEMLAVAWSLEKFHHYAYGRKVIVYTDHKPLEAIRKKPLNKAPKRLQTMLLKVQRYNFDLIYKPGKQIPVPDTLSRAPLGDTEVGSRKCVDIVCSIDTLPIKGNCLQRIQSESIKDEEMLALKKIILKGWPEDKNDTLPIIRKYYDFRDELGIQNGVITRGERIIVPKAIRKEMKEKIHMGHQGINSCLRRARELIYWPGMTSEIRQHIGNCHTCLAYSDKLPQETTKWHEVPERPWQKVGVDIFILKGRNYLVTVDYFSQFIEVDFLKTITSVTVITKLKHHFARYGIPETIITGGDTQLKSHKFNKFCEDWEIHHKMTSPYNSKSNGQVESAVKIIKNIMKKALSSNEDPYIGLLNYRNTPLENIGESPTQLLMGRRTKTLVPTSKELFKPTVTSYREVKQYKEEKRNKISEYERRKCILPEFKQGDTVYIQPLKKNEEWKKAVVSEVHTPRRMRVTTENGQSYIRNRMFLRGPVKGEKEMGGDVKNHMTPDPEATGSKEIVKKIEQKIMTPEGKSSQDKRDVKMTRSGRIVETPQRYRE